jgi:hypothetical protein
MAGGVLQKRLQLLQPDALELAAQFAERRGIEQRVPGAQRVLEARPGVLDGLRVDLGTCALERHGEQVACHCECVGRGRG